MNNFKKILVVLFLLVIPSACFCAEKGKMSAFEIYKAQNYHLAICMLMDEIFDGEYDTREAKRYIILIDDVKILEEVYVRYSQIKAKKDEAEKKMQKEESKKPEKKNELETHILKYMGGLG